MNWYKQYAEFATDPKVQAMSEPMQRRLVMLFCLHCSGDLQKLDDEELALALRIDADELEKTRALFLRKGFIGEGWTLPNWDKRQTSTDPTAAARMQRYRNKLRAKGESSYGYDRFRNLIMKRDRGTCVYCGSTENPCLDHMVPVDRGGDSQPDNLAIACKACNSGKSGRLVEETGYRFQNKEVAALYESAKQRLGVTVAVTPVTVTTSNSLRVDIEEERESPLSPPKGGKRSRPDPAPFNLPDWVPAGDWDAFVEMRRKIGKKLTDEGKQLAIKKLAKLRDDGDDPGEVLQQSVLASWQGLFPVHATAGRNGHAPARREDKPIKFHRKGDPL